MERTGPVRVTQSGLIPPERVRLAMMLVLALAALDGVYLIFVGGWPILAIGAASILSALAYSGGPFPLASHGLGDLFVFIFFGLCAVCGTYWVQAHALPGIVIAAAAPPGLLITAILVINNYRDMANDRKTGKRTLAVLLGKAGTRAEYVILLVVAYVIPVALLALGQARWFGLLPLLTLPLAYRLGRSLFAIEEGPALNRTLGGTAQLALLFSILFAVGLIL
jgi:1,4-dihydroxy-2-naphthoate octaprenyltransferase